MTDFVPDASMVMAWLMPDEATPATDALLARWQQGGDLYAPPLLRYEVSNALAMAHFRKKRITREQMEEKLSEFDMLSVQYDPDSPKVAPFVTVELACRYHLTVYDAAYLEIAARLKLPLATLDGPLKSAAQAMGVLTL